MKLGDLVMFHTTSYHLIVGGQQHQNYYLVQKGEVGMLIELLSLDRCIVLQSNRTLLTTTHYLFQE